jgi:hypothetical protein
VNTREQAPRSMGDETSQWRFVGTARCVDGMWRRQGTGNGKPPRSWARTIVTGKTKAEQPAEHQRSAVMTGIGARSEVLAQKVIRPILSVGPGQVRRLRVLCDGYRTVPLLDQPARQVGRGGLFEPLIEKRGDFLFQIGGVRESREFVGLKGVSRGGEKKFPRRLGAALGHENLPEQQSSEYRTHINHTVIYNGRLYACVDLWTAVEKAARAASCCSNCSGDYEDPDATAWEEDFEQDEDEAERAHEN